MTNKMFNIAKKKDDGRFAKLGMREYCSHWFGVGNSNAESVVYIVDTYLECIDELEFDTWINGTHYPTKPKILTRTDLESYFSDLLNVSEDLETISDLMMYLYEQDFWVDEANDCLYTCEYDDKIMSRHRLNFIGIAMEFERLCTKHELEMLEWKDIDTIVEILEQYGYNIKKDYQYRTNDVYETASNIEERLQQIFYL